MSISTVTTPIVVNNLGGRQGVAIYDNSLVTNNTHASVYIIWNDGTWSQDNRNDLTQVGTLTAAAALDSINGLGPGN
jgi:hypothetical protein